MEKIMNQINAFYAKIGFTKTALLVMFLVGVLEIQFAERYAKGSGGILMDGTGYMHAATHFEKLIAEKKINASIGGKVNRFVPSMFVHYALRITNTEFTPKNILHFFIYHNFFWILIGTWAWARIAFLNKLDEKIKWLGLILLFANYVMLKWNLAYVPVMTDTFAFVLGILLLLFYFEPKTWINLLGLCLVGLFGAFTWQTIAIYAYILLLFPKHFAFLTQEKTPLNYLVYTLPVGFFFYFFWNIYAEGIEHLEKNMGLVASFGQMPMYKKGIWVAVAFMAFFTFSYFTFLFRDSSFQNFRYLLRKEFWGRAIVVAGLMSLISFIHGHISDSSVAEPINSSVLAYTQVVSENTSFLQNLLSKMNFLFFYPLSLHYPFENIVPHAVFFGLAYVIAFVFFPRFAQEVRSSGIGMLLIFFISYSPLINPQSRIHTPLVPFVVFFVVLLAQRNHWRTVHIFVILAVSLFASKFWLITGESIGTPQNINLDMWIKFHMNLGTWSNLYWHAIHTFAFGLVGLYFWLFRKELLNLETTFEEKIIRYLSQKLKK